MRINLEELKKGPLSFEVDLTPQYLREEVEESICFEAARGSVTFRRISEEIVVTGQLKSTVHTSCARCLEDAVLPIQADVHLYYWPHDPEHEASKIADIDPEEPDFGIYRGEWLEPDEDLREILLVEVPDVILCSANCKGICPRCGQNLNESLCQCEPEAEEAQEEATPPSLWKDQLRKFQLPEQE
ncbi:DUF177 domain-containing protein [bacterium]|nr:DUF177 domain-containing protein [bacterium]